MEGLSIHQRVETVLVMVGAGMILVLRWCVWCSAWRYVDYYAAVVADG
jgi:hypothetical protein